MSASAPRIMIEPSWRGRVFGAEWRNAVGSTFDMIQPATGAAITRVGNASAEDVRQVAAHAIRLNEGRMSALKRQASSVSLLLPKGCSPLRPTGVTFTQSAVSKRISDFLNMNSVFPVWTSAALRRYAEAAAYPLLISRLKAILVSRIGKPREDTMTDLKPAATFMTPRRGFFTRVAGVMALGVAAFVPTAPRADTEADDGPDWPGKLTGRHKQVVDVYAVNDGYPLGFVLNFLTPNKSATGVVILRHEAFPLALNHAMWAKYKIGESEKIEDPETKAAAVKNPYFEPKPGALRNDNSAIDKLLARGTVFGACNLALRGHARRLAKNAGVTADEAAKEFTANIIPGITVIPSGVWGVNRAQEAGCTYCAGG